MSDEDFLKLCKSGNVGKVEEAIKDGANVNAKDNDGNTALMWAAYNGHTERVKLLIEHGANINAKDNDGETALMQAAFYGYIEIVKLLLEYGASVNDKDNEGWTALEWTRNTQIADLLRSYGAKK